MAESSGSSRNLTPAQFIGGGVAIVFLLFPALTLYRLSQLQSNVDTMAQAVQKAVEMASSAEATAGDAVAQASQAQRDAHTAAQGRLLAEQDRDSALAVASEARREQIKASQEVRRVRQQKEAELNRLHSALGRIVDTRRTALGLVMNLGSDALKFDFDKAHLRPENRELLSRIAGILLTSQDYAIQVLGHTDDVGSATYNQGLSLRRARAVRDYLVEAGLDPARMETSGLGKSRPLVEGATPEARAKNRRVEIGVVNTNVRYTQTAQSPGN